MTTIILWVLLWVKVIAGLLSFFTFSTTIYEGGKWHWGKSGYLLISIGIMTMRTPSTTWGIVSQFTLCLGEILLKAVGYRDRWKKQQAEVANDPDQALAILLNVAKMPKPCQNEAVKGVRHGSHRSVG